MEKTKQRILIGILSLLFCLVLNGGATAQKIQYCKDLDLDGYGDPTDCESEYEAGLVANSDDCNDSDASINPSAEDICGDLIDNNCLDGIDEDCSSVPQGNIRYCIDKDLDGYGDSNDCVNDPEQNYIANDGDCDDTNPTINSGAIEICGDGINNNCINGIDEGCSTNDNKQYYYLDADNDGYGDQASWEYVVNPSVDYVANPDDCNDQLAVINPAATEICSTTDLTDENCDSIANDGCNFWWEDADGDSYTSGNNYYDSTQQPGYVLATSLVSMDLDCNDQDATINPGAPEIFGDQIDQNCDGVLTLFTDQNLETCVLQHTGGSLDLLDLANISSLRCDKKYISNLGGIEYLTGVTDLNLSYNRITDLTPLAGLTNLIKLRLDRNYSHLRNLTGLENLTNLTFLSANYCRISDLSPLANLTNIAYLNLIQNDIVDLNPLAELINLTNLYLLYNDISDVAVLANLSKLYTLNLGQNEISDISPLANLTNLYSLNLAANRNINDLSPLQYFNTPNLTSLSLSYIGVYHILDISPLQYLNAPALKYLYLNHNSISDLTPLQTLNAPMLTYLKLDNNLIDNLAQLDWAYDLPNLTTLNLVNNCITDFTPVLYEGGPSVQGMNPQQQQNCM